jgi:hypothetical protein
MRIAGGSAHLYHVPPELDIISADPKTKCRELFDLTKAPLNTKVDLEYPRDILRPQC